MNIKLTKRRAEIELYIVSSRFCEDDLTVKYRRTGSPMANTIGPGAANPSSLTVSPSSVIHRPSQRHPAPDHNSHIRKAIRVNPPPVHRFPSITFPKPPRQRTPHRSSSIPINHPLISDHHVQHRGPRRLHCPTPPHDLEGSSRPRRLPNWGTGR